MSSHLKIFPLSGAAMLRLAPAAHTSVCTHLQRQLGPLPTRPAARRPHRPSAHPHFLVPFAASFMITILFLFPRDDGAQSSFGSSICSSPFHEEAATPFFSPTFRLALATETSLFTVYRCRYFAPDGLQILAEDDGWKSLTREVSRVRGTRDSR